MVHAVPSRHRSRRPNRAVVVAASVGAVIALGCLWFYSALAVGLGLCGETSYAAPGTPRAGYCSSDWPGFFLITGAGVGGLGAIAGAIVASWRVLLITAVVGAGLIAAAFLVGLALPTS